MERYIINIIINTGMWCTIKIVLRKHCREDILNRLRWTLKSAITSLIYQQLINKLQVYNLYKQN